VSSESLDGDQWIINGQKVWTSFAQDASHALLLSRFDPALPKHRGMAFFLLDMATPGVDVRLLRMMTGDAEFTEVFLDDVVVPEVDRVGDPGAGWAMALDVLMNERVAVGSVGEGRTGARPFDQIRAQATAPDEPVTRDRLAALVVTDEVQRLT
jgi:alkylation response protein AidB-like acyl-CoA dehydrogenase